MFRPDEPAFGPLRRILKLSRAAVSALEGCCRAKKQYFIRFEFGRRQFASRARPVSDAIRTFFGEILAVRLPCVAIQASRPRSARVFAGVVRAVVGDVQYIRQMSGRGSSSDQLLSIIEKPLEFMSVVRVGACSMPISFKRFFARVDDLISRSRLKPNFCSRQSLERLTGFGRARDQRNTRKANQD